MFFAFNLLLRNLKNIFGLEALLKTLYGLSLAKYRNSEYDALRITNVRISDGAVLIFSVRFTDQSGLREGVFQSKVSHAIITKTSDKIKSLPTYTRTTPLGVCREAN